MRPVSTKTKYATRGSHAAPARRPGGGRCCDKDGAAALLFNCHRRRIFLWFRRAASRCTTCLPTSWARTTNWCCCTIGDCCSTACWLRCAGALLRCTRTKYDTCGVRHACGRCEAATSNALHTNITFLRMLMHSILQHMFSALSTCPTTNDASSEAISARCSGVVRSAIARDVVLASERGRRAVHSDSSAARPVGRAPRQPASQHRCPAAQPVHTASPQSSQPARQQPADQKTQEKSLEFDGPRASTLSNLGKTFILI